MATKPDLNSVDLIELLQQRRQLMPVVHVATSTSQTSPGVSDRAAFQKVLSAAPQFVNVLSVKVVERITAHAQSTNHLHMQISYMYM